MIVGITGGMGSGKSSFARELEELGAKRIDADRVGHQVIERPEILRDLLAAFGEDLISPAGELNRRELGRRAFADEASCTRLNQIVHPLLEKELKIQIDRARNRGSENVVVVDAALIFEWGDLQRFDLIVVVDAKEEVRIERLIRGGMISEAEVRRRMACQMPVEEKTARADWVVDNNGGLQDLRRAAENLWPRLRDPDQVQGFTVAKNH